VSSPRTDENPLPREIAPGVFWLGECLPMPYDGGMMHSYQSVFLVTGTECSLLFEAGHPAQLAVIERQLEGLLAAGAAPLRYLFTSHSETPHAGGGPRLMEHFPELQFVGDATDLHLYAPEYLDRQRSLNVGAELDLGGTRMRVVPAVIRDHRQTLWAFDTARRVLFTSDGVAHTHHHPAGQCGRFAEETVGLDLPALTAIFAEAALHWTRFVDVEPYIDRFDALVDDLEVAVIAPTHGLPISDPQTTLALIRAGLRLGSTTQTRQSRFA